MRFHRISPCPKCGGKVKAKWERDGVQGLPAIEMLYPTVTFNSHEAAVKHIHETPGTWRITKIYRTLPVGEEVTEADDEC